MATHPKPKALSVGTGGGGAGAFPAAASMEIAVVAMGSEPADKNMTVKLFAAPDLITFLNRSW